MSHSIQINRCTGCVCVMLHWCYVFLVKPFASFFLKLNIILFYHLLVNKDYHYQCNITEWARYCSDSFTPHALRLRLRTAPRVNATQRKARHALPTNHLRSAFRFGSLRDLFTTNKKYPARLVARCCFARSELGTKALLIKMAKSRSMVESSRSFFCALRAYSRWPN